MKKNILFLVLSLLLVAGCSNAKERLGLAKVPPDEFAVVKRAPLAMPPDNKLSPPRPGMPRPQEQTTEDAARAAILGDSTHSAKTESDGEAALVRAAGGAGVSSGIREEVDAEASEDDASDVPVVKKLIGLGGGQASEGKTIDPVVEAERLKAQRQSGGR